jgi:hypothetical protein
MMITTVPRSGGLAINGVAVGPLYGGTQPIAQYGIVTSGEQLVSTLADGTDLNEVWEEFRELLGIWNNERVTLSKLLSYPTTHTADAVPQNVAPPSFERASELGVPRAAGLPGDSMLVGFDMFDYDLASRLSHRFLRDADRRQVDAILTSVLTADTTLTFGRVLRRLMTPTETHNEHHHRVFGLWNGTDGMTPPPFSGRTFSAEESHYIPSGAYAIDSADIEDAVRLVTRKGYGIDAGSQMLILANDEECDAIMGWRAGEPSRSGGPDATFDFVPSKNAPVYLTEKTIVGELAPGDFHGIPVLGSYGESWLLRTPIIPAGYVVVAASYGPDDVRNPVGFRQHTNLAYQGLRQIAGPGVYPIVESFHQRVFGVGVRHRGGAAVIQVTVDGEYVPPSRDQLPDHR